MTSWIKRILAPGTTTDAPPTEVEDWFAPETSGVYEGGPAAYRFIKFGAAQRVWIADDAHRAALDNPNAAGTAILVGSWSGAGRFSVSRQFQRPVVFVASGAPEGQLQLRVTDTTTQTTSQHTYSFQPG